MAVSSVESVGIFDFDVRVVKYLSVEAIAYASEGGARMNARRWINILISGLMGLLTLGGIWLLTRPAATTTPTLPSGELKPLAA
jgi:hypothetical protein